MLHALGPSPVSPVDIIENDFHYQYTATSNDRQHKILIFSGQGKTPAHRSRQSATQRFALYKNQEISLTWNNLNENSFQCQ